VTRESKLQYHLEMVIYKANLGIAFTGSQIEALMTQATPEQHEAAYQRALVHIPLLLDDERRPA
jgi:hypothetical protein